jgi:hypothetical protein
MAVYKRGESWHIDSTFHGQRIRESMGGSEFNRKYFTPNPFETGWGNPL